jgi:hypothetical protein
MCLSNRLKWAWSKQWFRICVNLLANTASGIGPNIMVWQATKDGTFHTRELFENYGTVVFVFGGLAVIWIQNQTDRDLALDLVDDVMNDLRPAFVASLTQTITEKGIKAAMQDAKHLPGFKNKYDPTRVVDVRNTMIVEDVPD